MLKILTLFLLLMLCCVPAMPQTGGVSAFAVQPLTGLNVQVRGGTINISGVPTQISSTTVTVAANSVTFIFITSTGLISSNTTGFSGAVPLAIVTSGSNFISNIQDSRTDYTMGGGGISSPVLINQTSDAFNRTAGNLGSNWTAYLNNFSVASGVITPSTAAQLNVAAYTGVSSSPTQTSKVQILSLNGTGDFPGAAVRISGTIGTSVSFYVCNETTTTLTLQRVVGASNSSIGTTTTLASVAITGVPGDTITLSIVGNTLSCQRNSTSNPILEVTDGTPLTTGLPGISQFGNTATMGGYLFLGAGAPAGATENIVFDGDSIIAANGNGSNGTDPATSFLYLPISTAYVTNLGVSAKCLGVGCAAASSGTIESMLSTGTSVVDTLFVPGMKNICVIFAGTNDIATAARTPAQVYTDLTTYVTARHAAGWKVIVVPNVSRTSITTPSVDNKINIYNSLINANTAAADAVVVMPNSLVALGASGNTTLFNSDQVHPTEVSHIDIMARAFISTLSKF